MGNILYRHLIIMFLLALLMACNSNEPDKSDAKKSEKITDEKTRTSAESDVHNIGKAVYKKHCLACHQANGSGVPGLYPPLQNTDWVSGDKDRLISVVVHGLQGEIEVNGEIYNNVMPNNAYLSDQEIAAVLTYTRSNFGNDAGPVTAEEVRKVRQQPSQQVP